MNALEYSAAAWVADAMEWVRLLSVVCRIEYVVDTNCMIIVHRLMHFHLRRPDHNVGNVQFVVMLFITPSYANNSP